MRLPRTSIAALMGAILFLALAFAALVRPTPLWAAICFSSMMLAFTYASLAAIFSRGGRRAYWTGFLVGGGSYLVLQYGPFCDEHVGPHTLSTAMLDYLNAALTFPNSTTVTLPPQIRATVLPDLTLRVAESPPAEVERMLERIARAYVPFPAQSSHDVWVFWTATAGSNSSAVPVTPREFYRVGHSLLSLLIAIAFALTARRVAERKGQSKADSSSHGSGPAATLGARVLST